MDSRHFADIPTPQQLRYNRMQRVDLALQSVGPYLQDIPLFVTVPGLLERAALEVQTSVAVKGASQGISAVHQRTSSKAADRNATTQRLIAGVPADTELMFNVSIKRTRVLRKWHL